MAEKSDAGANPHGIVIKEWWIYLLLGLRGVGEEGELARFLTDVKAR